MIKNYKLFTEGILGKLKGPTEKDVIINLKKQYEDGKINIENYYNKTKKYNIKEPSLDKISDGLKKEFENGSFDIIDYFNKSKKYNTIGPTYDDILKNTSPDELLKTCFSNFDDVGVEYALDHGASKELYNKSLEMKEWFLDLISDMEEVKQEKLSDIIIWKKDGENLFMQMLFNNTLDVNYKIYLVLKDKYGYDKKNLKPFILNIMEKHLNWKINLIIYTSLSLN